MDSKIIYLYSKGLSTRKIAEALEERYGTGVSPTLISCVGGLKGFPDAINAVFTEARIQKCIMQYGSQLHEVRTLERLQSDSR